MNQASHLQTSAMLTSFPLGHDDYVHDLAFDVYGRRIATCSSDQKIRIWEKRDDEWILSDELAGSLGHQAAVLRVKWADPEFGSVLATSSFDKSVYIWEEVEAKEYPKKLWTRRFNFVEKEAVLDIKFAPKHWGLMIAVAVADGCVKVYAAKDLNNLTQWHEVHEIYTNTFIDEEQKL